MGVFDSFKKFLSFGDGAPTETKTSTPSGIPTAPMKFEVGAGLTSNQSKTAQTAIKKQVSYAEKEKASKQLAKVKKVESAVKSVGNVPIPVPTGRSIFESLPGAKLVTTAMKLPAESPVTSIKVKDIPRETIQATGGSLFRTLARGALEFSPETAKARDEGKTTPRLVPSTKEAKFLIGEEEIRPISEGPIASKVSSPFVALAERMGATPSTAGKVGAIPALAFGAFIENPFIGSTAKAGKELSQEVIEKVAKSAKADEIFDIVKPFFKEFSDDEVKLVAKELETVTDPKVVNQVIGNKISSFEKAKQIFDSKDFSKVKPLEVQTRLTDLPQTKQRSYLRTILDSDTASPKLKEEVAKLDQTYETITNQETLDRARALVATDYDEALKVVKEKPVSDEMTGATAQTLIKKAEAEGRYDDAIDIVRTIDERARDAGRYIQSLSLWSKLSPEGMLRFAQREIRQANEAKGRISKIVGTPDIELDTDLAQTILTKMKQAQAMPDGPAKIKLVTEVMQDIANKVPPSFSEMFDAYRYQNILSGPRTQLRNLYGNAFQTFVTKPATMATEAFIDTIGAGITGKERTKYFSDVPLYLRETTNAIPDAVRAFAETWRGERLSGNLDMRMLRQKNLPKSLTVISRLMEGTDQFLQTMIGAGEYAVQRRAGVPDEIAKEEAQKVAQYFLLRKPTDAKNLTGQGKMLSKLDAASDAVIDLGNKFKSVRWFVPFVRTPINAAKQWVEYSPLGAVNMLSGGVAKKQEAAAKALLGSTVFALGAQKAWDGETTWSAPTDPEQKKLFYASGKKPYSVRVGDKWVPMIYAGPFALALAIPAAMKYHSEENPNAMDMSAMEKTYRTLLGSVEFFSQQTFMQGLGTYVSLLSGDPDSSLPASMAYTSSQALPLVGMVRYVNNNFIDPTFRKSTGFLETLKKDLPVLSKDVPAIVGPEGTEQKRQLYNAFTPYDIGPHVEEYNRILKLRQEASAIRKQLKASDSEIDAQASQIIETFKDRTAEENIALLEDLEKENPEMVKSIADQLKKESESKDAEVRFYKGLEVKNGMRAMFILDRMKELEPGTETENFLLKLAEEGVLTEDILEQIAELKAQQ